MSKRLQVLFEDDELQEIRDYARRCRMTVAEWVRTSLRQAREREPERSVRRKLEAVRLATRQEFPTGDIDQILREIDLGYRQDSE